MAKPTVTLRNTKGSALSYTELDQNFTNLRDSTLTLTAGSGGTAVTADLNGNITIVAGSNVTITGDNSAKTITIASTGGSGLTIDGSSGDYELQADIDLNNFVIRNSLGNIKVSDDILFESNSTGPTGSGTLLIRNSTSNDTNLTLTANEVSVKGPFKFEQYTTTQRNALTAANGHVIYNSTDNKFQGYANGTWVDLH